MVAVCMNLPRALPRTKVRFQGTPDIRPGGRPTSGIGARRHSPAKSERQQSVWSRHPWAAGPSAAVAVVGIVLPAPASVAVCGILEPSSLSIPDVPYGSRHARIPEQSTGCAGGAKPRHCSDRQGAVVKSSQADGIMTRW